MAIEKINIQQFIELAETRPVLDVRSPAEYNHAHFPSAFSLPLFSDEERKVVGTAYKQQSREKAIKIGLEYFGPKTVSMIETMEKIYEVQSTKCAGETGLSADRTCKPVLMYCWRGGMRSAAVAWLLDLYGFKVFTLAGGYKTFRNWVLKQFEKEYPFKIIGGYTGSGKTKLLYELIKKNEIVLDLESLANHKGSAFGNLDGSPQPSQEMFENKLAVELRKKDDKCFMKDDRHKEVLSGNCQQPPVIWMEDESQRIGDVNIPNALFSHIRTKPVFFLNIPFDERLDNIMYEYGKFEKEKILNAIMRIKKRLGGLEAKTAVNFLMDDELKNCFAVLLKYYDKWYVKSLHNRQNLLSLLHTIPLPSVDVKANAEILLQLHHSKISAHEQ